MAHNSVSVIQVPYAFGKTTGAKMRHGDIFRFKDGEVVYMALDEFYVDATSGEEKRGRRKIVALTTGNVYPLNPTAEVKLVGHDEAVQIVRSTQ